MIALLITKLSASRMSLGCYSAAERSADYGRRPRRDSSAQKGLSRASIYRCVREKTEVYEFIEFEISSSTTSALCPQPLSGPSRADGARGRRSDAIGHDITTYVMLCSVVDCTGLRLTVHFISADIMSCHVDTCLRYD